MNCEDSIPKMLSLRIPKSEIRIWILVACLFSCAVAVGDDALKVVSLRCEYLQDPLGIDETEPRLSWRLESSVRGQKQTAYRVLVASSVEKLDADDGDRWDSGKVASSQTIHIAYNGKPLQSRQQCFWKVKVWDRDGSIEAKWSEPASWSMGLLSDDDWSAKYISYCDETPVFKDQRGHFLPPARQYRKEFSTAKRIKRAVIHATALGIYELHLNGRRVGDEWFAPGWTDYRKRAYYNTYDVTELIRGGANAVGAWVAEGWYSGYVGFGLLVGIGAEGIGRYTYGKTPSVMVQLEIEYEDGSREIVGSDESWKVTANGPIEQADLLMGEWYDARKETPGWSLPGLDDSDWQQAIFAEKNGHPKATFYEFQSPAPPDKRVQIKGREVDLGFKRPRLEAFPGVPVRVTEEIKPIEVTRRGEGTYIFNLGQNFAGTVRLKVEGTSGHRVTLRYGEMLHPDGRLMTENLRRARATDYFICNGEPDGEVYVPRFTFHGFQYVEVANLPGKPTLDTITGLVLHSDTPLASTFECSDPMVNQLFKNVVRTQRANFLDLPTDCPQRDERMGWTGDAQAYVATAAYNADIGAFYTKWLRELMESQRPSGAFPGYAPFPFQHGWDFGTAWADAGVICPWTIWQFYGDTRVIEDCWEPMTRFMKWRKRTSVDDLGVSHGNAWGDWLAQGAKTPLDYVDTVYFAISTNMMAEMAAAIGRDEEAAAYRAQFAATKAAFQKKYLSDDGGVNVKSQTAQALALFADLVPKDKREATGQKLSEMIAVNGNHMATGFLGTRPLLPVLSSVGQNDLATFLLQSREFPSWGYEIENGATTIWERWDSFTKEEGFGRHNAAMNSFSHYAFGAVCEWMFANLAGIQSDGPGFKKIIIRPNPPAPGSNAMHDPIDWVKASYDSIHGKIVTNWKLDGDRLVLDATIPANTTAAVYIPTSDVQGITESGQPLSKADGVRFLKSEAGRAILHVESGHYRFASTSGIAPARVALKTSTPADLSLNPENFDLTKSREVIRWDFRDSKDVAKWPTKHNLKFEKRGDHQFIVATGGDPQLVTKLAEPLEHLLILELKARPAKGTSAQFFWASPTGGFNARQQTGRQLNPADEVNVYLFRLGNGQPLQSIRFDPFANQGEMEIESIAVYQLTD